MDYATTVKSLVSTPELFAHYGFKRDRNGMICCPFHGEKTPSMKVYNGAGGYHCFGGCGAHGDVLDFVQQYFKLSFYEALSKINNDFNLGLPIDTKDRKRQKESMDAAEKRRREMERIQSEYQRLRREYEKTMAEWIRLDNQKREYSPKPGDDELHPLFLEAVSNLEGASYRLDRAESELYLFDLNKTV